MNEINELKAATCCHCPTNDCAVIFSITTSIANEEEALACILNAECAKINRVLQCDATFDQLIAIDTSVQQTLAHVTELEGVLKAKLDAILPLLTVCLD